MNALGVDLGGTKIEAVVLGADGGERWRRRVPTPQGDYAGTVAAIAALVAAARGHEPFTVGVGTPGTLTREGRVKNANSTVLNGRPLQADLEAALGRPVAMANDANCLALSEATDGAGAGAAVVFAAIVGTGVGAGIAVHGRVLQGPNGLAGEWGHVPLPWADDAERERRCWCGRRGCIEALCAGPALAADHGGGLGAEQVAARAAAGDGACAMALERHANRLARALAMVVDVLDPDVVVLGGGLSKCAPLVDRVPALWGRWVFGAAADGPVRTRLVAAAHGDASGVRGAAWIGRAAG